MKQTIALLIFIFCFLSVIISSAADPDHFSAAVNAYRKGDFAGALSHFKKTPDSPVKFYNLGNCYYKLDSLGLSILHYEKAKKLAGEDPDLMNNLQMARAKTRDKIEAPRTFFLIVWLRRLILFFPAWFFAACAILSSALGSIFFVLLIRQQHFERRKKIFFSTCASLLLLIISLFMSWRRESTINTASGVVILAPAASVLNEPVFGATELFVLHEGTVLEFLDQEPGWVKVRLPQGTSGYLRDQQVGKF